MEVYLSQAEKNNIYINVMQNNFFEEGAVLSELHKYEEKIEDELSKDNIDNDKIMKLRYEQLIKGMLMTQDPNYEY